MKKDNFTQLTFDFCSDSIIQEGSSQAIAPPFEKKVLYLAPYRQSKEQERNAQLYKNIFDSIKHIG